MAEAAAVTFANFRLGEDSIYDIGGGTVTEIADRFGFNLDDVPNAPNLGALIGVVAPEKELQLNIAHAKEVLGSDSLAIARSWVGRTALLEQVDRAYMSADAVASRTTFDVAVVTDGVRNWMHRRGQVLVRKAEAGVCAIRLVVAGGNRPMREAEGDDFIPGVPAYNYLVASVVPAVESSGMLWDKVKAEDIVVVPSSKGDEVMASLAERLYNTEFDFEGDEILLATNAGNWVQNGGQLRRAFRSYSPQFDTNPEQRQLFIASDSFPVGETGDEPTATHQNPYSAIGIILRGAQELLRHEVAA